MHCKICWADCEPGVKYCPACGAPLSLPDEPVPTAANIGTQRKRLVDHSVPNYFASHPELFGTWIPENASASNGGVSSPAKKNLISAVVGIVSLCVFMALAVAVWHAESMFVGGIIIFAFEMVFVKVISPRFCGGVWGTIVSTIGGLLTFLTLQSF